MKSYFPSHYYPRHKNDIYNSTSMGISRKFILLKYKFDLVLDYNSK